MELNQKVNRTKKITLKQGDIVLLGYTKEDLTYQKVRETSNSEFIVLAEYISGDLGNVAIRNELVLSSIMGGDKVVVSPENPQFRQFEYDTADAFEFWKKATPKQVELYKNFTTYDFLTRPKLEYKVSCIIDKYCERMKELVSQALKCESFDINKFSDKDKNLPISIANGIIATVEWENSPQEKKYIDISDEILSFLYK